MGTEVGGWGEGVAGLLALTLFLLLVPFLLSMNPWQAGSKTFGMVDQSITDSGRTSRRRSE